MGFGNTLMFIYFLANFLTFEPYYMWINAVVAFSYFWKMYFFFKMVYADETQDSIDLYYEDYKWGVPLLYPSALIMIVLKYFEWGVLPVYQILGWGVLLYLNYYNFTVLKDWGNVDDDTSFFTLPNRSTVSDRKPTSRGTPKKVQSAFEDEEVESGDSQIKVILL